MSPSFDRSDPDWTFDDSWQEEEQEPIVQIPCPCNCHRPASVSCDSRLATIMRALRNRTVADLELHEEAAGCWRCFDSGVVEAE